MSKATDLLNTLESTMTSYYHVTTKRNSKRALQKGLVPRIGKRSQEFGELDKAIYLFTSVEDAEDAVMNWLGDEFDEADELVLLEIRVSSDFPITKEEGQFEAKSEVPIPARYIKLLKEL